MLAGIGANPTARADHFVDARYDAQSDELVVTMRYKGTNPNHDHSNMGSMQAYRSGSETPADYRCRIGRSMAGRGARIVYQNSSLKLGRRILPSRPSHLTNGAALSIYRQYPECARLIATTIFRRRSERLPRVWAKGHLPQPLTVEPSIATTFKSFK